MMQEGLLHHLFSLNSADAISILNPFELHQFLFPNRSSYAKASTLYTPTARSGNRYADISRLLSRQTNRQKIINIGLLQRIDAAVCFPVIRQQNLIIPHLSLPRRQPPRSESPSVPSRSTNTIRSVSYSAGLSRSSYHHLSRSEPDALPLRLYRIPDD